MYDLQSKDPETWDSFLDVNLSVSKSLVSFFSIGVDHALEQENKSMNIQGRIKRVGNNESALLQVKRFFEFMRSLLEPLYVVS